MALKKDTGFGSFPLENAALGLLIAGPKHGYALYQEFTCVFHLIWSAGQTNFYIALSSLDDQGLVRVTKEAQQGRPSRKVYTITEEGHAAFMRWLHTPVPSMRAMRVELLGKLRFYDVLGLPGTESFIDDQIAVLQQMLDEWATADAASQVKPPDVFHDLVADFRARQARFIIDWLLAAREKLMRKKENISHAEHTP